MNLRRQTKCFAMTIKVGLDKSHLANLEHLKLWMELLKFSCFQYSSIFSECDHSTVFFSQNSLLYCDYFQRCWSYYFPWGQILQNEEVSKFLFLKRGSYTFHLKLFCFDWLIFLLMIGDFHLETQPPWLNTTCLRLFSWEWNDQFYVFHSLFLRMK